MKLRILLILLFSMSLLIGCTDATISEDVLTQLESILSSADTDMSEIESVLSSDDAVIIEPESILLSNDAVIDELESFLPSTDIDITDVESILSDLDVPLSQTPTPSPSLSPTPSPSPTPTLIDPALLVDFSASIAPAWGGYLTGPANGGYLPGTKINIIAHPEAPYQFHSWVLNGTEVSKNRFYSFTLEGDTVLTANLVTPTPSVPSYSICYEDDVWTDVETVPLPNAEVGKLVRFGTYEQDNDLTNGTEPIDWIVLDVQDNKAFLLSKYVLFAARYHNYENVPITWEQCKLREQLNNEFYNNAFSQSEKDSILLTHNINQDNPTYGTDGGADTDDYAFLLSLDEVGQYLTNEYFPFAETGVLDRNLARGARPTQYAFSQKAFSSHTTLGDYGKEPELTTDNTWYYLRTPGHDASFTAVIHATSDIYEWGFTTCTSQFSQTYWGAYIETITGVRPALWVDLSAVH